MTSIPGRRGRGLPSLSAHERLPRVAILGRPNVGKSTLFNMLIGRRRAITHFQPGVTRDPVEVECSFGDTRILLIDTGGYTRGEGIDELVSERSLQSAREADLVLLVLDATETTPEDEDFIERLRPLSEKLILVVNKVDTPDRDSLVWNAHVHGFPSVIGVSAAHARNLDALRDMVSTLLQAQPSREAEVPGRNGVPLESWDERVRVAILGKPNTGKSSLANRLVGEERSIVSAIPGTTRDVVEGAFTYNRKSIQILDTAGIRRRSRIHEDIEYYSVGRAVESVRQADLVFLMIDAVEGLSDQDKKIADFAIKEGRGIILVLNKWDLVAGAPREQKAASERVRFFFPVLGFAPIVPISALTGFGIKALLDTTLEVWSQLHRRIGTGRLNQALESWVERYPLPVRGKNYKLRFATQVSENPVRFVVFTNRIGGFPLGYLQYLENCIRRDLGFPSIPVSIELKQSRKAGSGRR